MKRLGICLVVIVVAGFTLSAEESDVIQRARTEAAEDSMDYHAFWWGVGGAAITALPVVYSAFFADALTVDARRAIAVVGPAVGATGLALTAYFTGTAAVPEARIAGIQNDVDDPGLVSLYQTEYAKALTRLQRRTRGSAALLGAGLTVAAISVGFLIVYVTK